MLPLVKRKTKIKEILFIILFLSPAILHFSVYWLYINIDTIRLTFFEWQPMEGIYNFVGFKNYANIFKGIFLGEDRQVQQAFLNSLNGILINIIVFPIAIIVAYAFYKKVPGTPIFRVIFYLPSVISMVALCAAYREMFGSETPGPFAQFFAFLGINPPHAWLNFEIGSKTFWPLVYMFCIFNGLGTNVILISSAMQRIPKEVSEAAKLDGSGFFHELIHITIPLIMPTIATWAMLIFTSVYNFYMQPMLISNEMVNLTTDTTAWIIFRNIQNVYAPRNLIFAASLGIVLSLFVMPFTIGSRVLLNRKSSEATY